jgi:AcrR family transcriptional regulator
MTERHASIGTETDEDALVPDAEHRLDELVIEAVGEDAARTMKAVWRAAEEYERARRPGEGLRERKKRITRQRISDIATTLFTMHGYDAVTVAEVADRVGVSEKTIYNYFPTKESLVFDEAEERMSHLTDALRDRQPGTSPSSVVLAALRDQTSRLGELTSGTDLTFLLRFGEMIHNAPALRAAWAELRDRLAESITEVLAHDAGVDPRDPEPMVAARALVSIQDLFFTSVERHLRDGMPHGQVLAAVDADLERAARLLDTGLWSFHILVEGRRTREQLVEAAAAAEAARQQVVAALRQARKAWREIRAEQHNFRADERGTRRGRRRH